MTGVYTRRVAVGALVAYDTRYSGNRCRSSITLYRCTSYKANRMHARAHERSALLHYCESLVQILVVVVVVFVAVVSYLVGREK